MSHRASFLIPSKEDGNSLVEVPFLSPDAIRETLANHAAIVKFTKKDGSIRVMECLSYADIPKDADTSRLPAISTPDLVVVWEKNKGFRSFHARSVLSFTPILPKPEPKPPRIILSRSEWMARHYPNRAAA